MPRKWVVRILITLAVVAGVGYLVWQLNDQQQALRLHGHTYHISIMRTREELMRGLSGTNSLPANQAMVFVFPGDDKWAIWMKDMKYPIDIVWLDKNKLVVYLIKNAQPSSYPKTQFKPDRDTRYVIEFPSGTIDMTGIRVGDPAGLPSGV
jgi:uncharacterized protein